MNILDVQRACAQLDCLREAEREHHDPSKTNIFKNILSGIIMIAHWYYCALVGYEFGRILAEGISALGELRRRAKEEELV